MPICSPCRVPHIPDACEDTVADRRGLARRCYCQHKEHLAVATGPSPDPEPEIPESGAGHDVRVKRRTTTTTPKQGNSSEHQR